MVYLAFSAIGYLFILNFPLLCLKAYEDLCKNMLRLINWNKPFSGLFCLFVFCFFFLLKVQFYCKISGTCLRCFPSNLAWGKREVVWLPPCPALHSSLRERAG